MAFTRELYKLGFEISPVILCDGVAQSIRWWDVADRGADAERQLCQQPAGRRGES